MTTLAKKEKDLAARVEMLECELGKRILKSAKSYLIDEWATRGRIADEFADGIDAINKHLRKYFSNEQKD